MCPMLYYEYFKTRHKDLVREANQQRLIKTALSGQPRTRDKAQIKVGEFLIRFGSRLQSLPTPQPPTTQGYNGNL